MQNSETQLTRQGIGNCGTLALGFLIVSLVGGCRGAHFTVQSAPVPPAQAPSFRNTSPEIPVVVQLANFTIGQVDTQYPEREKELFRHHVAIALPNMLQEFLGKKQVFSNVTRSDTPIPAQADYVVTGNYDFFERLGTGGREWIPFYGTFGGKINEAWVKATMMVVVTDAKVGVEIMRKSYPEEHRDRTSVYQRPNVGYLQADYLAGIAADITKQIEAVVTDTTGKVDGGASRKQRSATDTTVETVAGRLKKLEALRGEGLISEREFQERRTRILDEATGR